MPNNGVAFRGCIGGISGDIGMYRVSFQFERLGF